MYEFVMNNIYSIIAVVLILIALLIAYKMGKVEFVKKVVLSLVIQAEKALGSGTGELKYALVIEKLYTKLPLVLRVLFTAKDIDKFIEEAVIKLKEVLDKGRTLTGYDDERYIKITCD